MASDAKSKPEATPLQACGEAVAVDTRDYLGRISDKWTILLVVVLSYMPGNRGRFSELKRALEGISQTVLTSTLRSLERDGIVVREVFPEVPPRVEYQLTELGLALLTPMKSLTDWVVRNGSRVKAARESYDQGQQSTNKLNKK